MYLKDILYLIRQDINKTQITTVIHFIENVKYLNSFHLKKDGTFF